MTLPEPFAYPVTLHLRKHGPAGYEDYTSYKPWLRDEFAFRCVYCLERERWYPSRADAFSVDHVSPQSTDATRIGDYDNLVYACSRCNSTRRELLFITPTTVVMSRHLRLQIDGSLGALSQAGQDLIDQLHLNESPALEVRQGMLLLLQLKAAQPENAEIHQIFLAAFGYPEDLPNLAALRPPGGNSRPDGLLSCYFAQATEGTLPKWY